MKKIIRSLLAILATAVLLFHPTPVSAVTEVMSNQGTPGTRGPWLVSHGPYAPTVTQVTLSAQATACLLSAGATCTTILASTDISAYENFTIYFLTGAATVENVNIFVSPDGTNWRLFDNYTFVDRAVSTVAYLPVANASFRYMKIEGRASAESTVKVWFVAH